MAILGASERNYYSTLAVRALERVGFEGELHLVNRRGGSAYGRPCAPDCASLGAAVDAAYLCVPYAATLEAAAEAADAGIPNLVIVSSGFAEVGGDGATREAELRALCEARGVRALGPNCLGYRNMLDRVALGSIPFAAQEGRGSVALVSASGSLANFAAQYGVRQGLEFTHVVATGNEMNVSIADLLDYLLGVEAVGAVALFMETVKDAPLFAAAAERARTLGRPVVVLKAGAALATAAIAQAHTSALVGDDRVFDAACDRFGVVRVDTIEDLICTAGLLSTVGPMRRSGVALVSMSGGMCEVVSDLAPALGVTLPPFSEATAEALRGVASEFGAVQNPLDLTGAAVRDESLWLSVSEIVGRDPGVGLTLVNWEVPAVADPPLPTTQDNVGRVVGAGTAPAALVTNAEVGLNEHGRAYLRRHGIGFALPGLRHAVVAAGRLAWWSERLRRPPAPPRAESPAAGPRPRNELETLEHLARFGVPVVPMRAVRTAAEAAEAAGALGGPVVLKVLSPDIAHKSEAGGVRLGLAGPEAAARAFDETMAAAAAHAPAARLEGAVVAPMRGSGLEVLVGVVRDAQWGPALAVGLGGVWTEALEDTALVLLPADAEAVGRALRSLKAAKLFAGWRGAPAVDLARLAAAVVAIGEAALALGPDLQALEVNPLHVRGGEIEALDALATWS